MDEIVVTEELLAAKFASVLPHLDERQRRLFLGAEARMLGRGGGRLVARVAGVREATVSRGVQELEAGQDPLGRVRVPGGGRKRAEEVNPGLVAALMALVEPQQRGDPMSPLRWTTMSLRNLAAELARQGYRVSTGVVSRLLREQGFSLQSNAKTVEGRQHPDRDRQFRYINDQAAAFRDAGDPVVSVDTKKKELIGLFANNGQEWRPAGDPIPVNDHDWFNQADGCAIPYGIYDLEQNTGWVNVGTDHDTAAFAVESVRRWWRAQGRNDYPDRTRLLITADAGGSNSYRTHGWKAALAALAAETGLDITVCHFPPGTSKWNKIEHRLFSHVTMNWRGRPLTSHQVVVNTIAATTTRTGLRVHAELDTNTYPTGIKTPKEQIERVPINRHDWHGDWNYTITAQPAPAAPTPPAAIPDKPSTAWLRHPAITGLPTTTWADLLTKLTLPYQAQQEARRFRARGGPRRNHRTAPQQQPTFTLADRLTAVILDQRHALTKTAAARLTGMSRRSIRDAIHDITPLLPELGYPIDKADPPIRTPDELTALATQNGITIPPEINIAC